MENQYKHHHNHVFHPGVRMSYEFQRHLATRQMPYKEKCHTKLNDFFGLLNRAIRHPDKLNLYLSKTYGKPLRGRGPFQDTTKQVPPERSHYSHYPFFGLRSTGINYPTPTSKYTPSPRPVNPDDRSHLVTAITAAKLSFKPLQIAEDLLLCFTKRVYEKSPGLSITDANSGLPQMAGFCFQIMKITREAIASSGCIQETSYIGLKIASEFLQDPHGLYYLMKGVIRKFESRTNEDNITAKIKMHLAQDEAINAYQKMGKSGFEGNWAGKRGHNPDIIHPEEMQNVLFALVNAFMGMTVWADSMIELFEVLVYSDDIEKSYVLGHLRSMRIQDHIDIILKIKELRKLTNQVHRFLIKIHETADRIIFILCPPRNKDGTLLVDPSVFMNSEHGRKDNKKNTTSHMFSPYYEKLNPSEASDNECTDELPINQEPELIINDQPENVKENFKKLLNEMDTVLQKLENVKLTLNDLSSCEEEEENELKTKPNLMKFDKPISSEMS